MVLIVAAGLLVGTFERLATVPLGFDADRVLTVNVDVTRALIDPANRVPFFDQLVAAVAAVPGVAHAGASMATPRRRQQPDGHHRPARRAAPTTRTGSGAFLELADDDAQSDHAGMARYLRTAVLAGRDVDERDAQGAPPVALVNEAYVHKFLPGRNPIGETIRFPDAGTVPPRTIVGVVSDAVYISARDGARPTLYIPLAQRATGGPTALTANVSISVRPSAGSPALLAPRVAAALTGVDRNLTFTFRPLQDRVDAVAHAGARWSH